MIENRSNGTSRCQYYNMENPLNQIVMLQYNANKRDCFFILYNTEKRGNTKESLEEVKLIAEGYCIKKILTGSWEMTRFSTYSRDLSSE